MRITTPRNLAVLLLGGGALAAPAGQAATAA